MEAKEIEIRIENESLKHAAILLEQELRELNEMVARLSNENRHLQYAKKEFDYMQSCGAS